MSYRIERVNSLIRQEISQLLQREVKDPRLGSFIAITEVSTAPDLKHARIYVSHLGSEMEKQETLKALTAAAGYFRRELAKVLKLRYIPELSFHWDNSIEQADRISRILDHVIPERSP
ncbi:MAG: 30S ribosome-binding factor RbfA [Chloroflexi bacterium]|nr:30S ribosome-binding factor RbfA [Chloroflexota bacterium]